MPKKSKYNQEFKREAVKLAQSSDKTLMVIADELGVHYKTLSNWVIQAVNNPDTSTKNNITIKNYRLKMLS